MANSWTDMLWRLAESVLEAASGADRDEIDDDTSEQARQQAEIWKLRLAYERAAEAGDLDEVVLAITGVLRGARVGLLAWLDLLEEIVQVTEQRFGTRPGRGKYKAAQVKAAFRRLLRRSDTRSAAFVELVGPSTMDLITGWLIDFTVALLNKDEQLWQADTVAARIPLRTRVVARLVGWLSSVLDWFSERPVLDPRLYDDVERIAQGPGSPLRVVDRVIEFGDWLVTHREQTLALMALVDAACDEVEIFVRLRGSEAKQHYARNLVLAALDDAGLELRGAGRDVAEAVIDVLIDFVVSTKNKPGKFEHANV